MGERQAQARGQARAGLDSSRQARRVCVGMATESSVLLVLLNPWCQYGGQIGGEKDSQPCAS